MDEHEQLVKKLATADSKELVVKIRYLKKDGYYLEAALDGKTVGNRVKVEEAKRFSPKTLGALAVTVRNDEAVQNLIQQVCNSAGVKLK